MYIPAVLMIMDDYLRFVKIYLLTDKSSAEINQRMKNYIARADRQGSRKVNHYDDHSVRRVKEVLTDKGREFFNTEMENWYESKGIAHTKVGPKASQLNFIERTHQTLVEMVKSMLHQSGLPRLFWVEAMETAVYIGNRVFCKDVDMTPYEKMFGEKSDLYHIRAFGSLCIHTCTEGRAEKLI
ncbi:Integrase, catalytic core protein [Phytophthora megakarya]|uniref:Integrase, catalytic core protein n=1 Tax=Phytophthora megakarya TaxID=4795 RepID=A0A225VEW7_9STRA|nr:Integrase, catalytic core protein [Phytophthora megakarya]